MASRSRRALLVGFVAAMALALGCATHTGHGALTGGALGAGAGALIGHAAGDSGLGALIGLGSGALLGGLAGNAVDAYDAGYREGSQGRYPEPPPRYRYDTYYDDDYDDYDCSHRHHHPHHHHGYGCDDCD